MNVFPVVYWGAFKVVTGVIARQFFGCSFQMISDNFMTP